MNENGFIGSKLKKSQINSFGSVELICDSKKGDVMSKCPWFLYKDDDMEV